MVRPSQTASPSPKECVPTAPLEYMLPLDIHLVEAEEQTSVAFWQRGHQPSQKGAQHRRGGPFFRLSIGKSMPFSSPKMLPAHTKMGTFPDLHIGCCCGDSLKCICALKYNKNYGGQAARTKFPWQVGGLTQKSPIFYYCHL